MAKNDLLYNRQFAQQEVLRTITLGLSPFIPFSQQYVMKMKEENQNLTMMPNPPINDKSEDDVWRERKEQYFEQPLNSEREILDKAPRVDVKEVSHKLNALFDNMGKKPSARTFEESVVGEILSAVGASEIDKKLNELGTPIQKGIDSSALFKNPATGGQGFDRQMTDSIRTVMSAAFGGRDMSGVVAIEETEAKVSKELQDNLKGLSGSEAISKFKKNADKVYGNLNKLLKKLKIGESGIKGALDKAYSDPFIIGDTYQKQLVARAIDLVKADLGGKEYMYTVPIGNTGMAGTVFINTAIKNRAPHINYSIEIAKTGGHGRLIELMGYGLGKLNTAAGMDFMENIPKMDMIAMNESILTADRVGFIGQMQEVQLSTMLDAGADIAMSNKKSSGVMGLAPKAMADSLGEQIKMGLQDSKGDFRKVYLELIAKANKASAAWKATVNPPESFTGRLGVWKRGGNNWNDAVGEDFSVSPFLMVRRKGVASFKPDNRAKIFGV
mgnify:FL=1|tara:strand:+ start:1529 stop:3025 length:1497 start_codon:yes stop_codon:yes gene_type:complete